MKNKSQFLSSLPAPHIPSRFAYPVCCGAPTVLRVFGWYCATCATYHAFRDDTGASWADRQRLAPTVTETTGGTP
jgi:hypothetical protein